MLKKIIRIIVLIVVFSLFSLGALVAYGSAPIVKLRANWGQNNAQFIVALQNWKKKRYTQATSTFIDLALEEHRPTIEFICGILDARSFQPQLGDACLNPTSNLKQVRLQNLSDAAVFGKQWGPMQMVLEKRADLNDPRVHFDFARYYHFTQGINHIPSEVKLHIQKSAEMNDPRGQLLYAILNIANDAEENVVELFNQSVLSYLSKQPSLTNHEAYFELAKLVQSGLVQTNVELHDILVAADQAGNPYAASMLAQFDLNSDISEQKRGQISTIWMERAANQGDPVAQYNFAIQLLQNQNTNQDLMKAEGMLQKSAQQGFAPAQTTLGNLYWQQTRLFFDDIEIGRKSAIDKYKIAANLGDANAMFNLGQIELALGNLNTAQEYFINSSDRGHSGSAQILEEKFN